MSVTSYRTALTRDKIGAADRYRACISQFTKLVHYLSSHDGKKSDKKVNMGCYFEDNPRSNDLTKDDTR